MKLSVIIPVYKVEDYLERCVNSVLNQDYRDLEVILVDDGSPDRCPSICDEFAKKDERVRVIHKENGGLSSARNAGIEVAQGEFLAFLDSDDQWTEGKLRPLMENVVKHSPDMTQFLSYNLYNDGSIMLRDYGDFFSQEWNLMGRNKYYDKLISYGNMMETAYTKILKTSFVKKNNLIFKTGIIGEDTEWLFRVLRIIDHVAVSSVPLVLYTAGRPGSIVNTSSVKKIRDVLSTIQSSLDYYKEHSTSETKNNELAQCAYLWSSTFGLMSYLNATDRKTVKPEMITVVKQLDLDSHPKSRMVSKLYKLCGFSLTSKILGTYIKLHRRNYINRKKKVN